MGTSTEREMEPSLKPQKDVPEGAVDVKRAPLGSAAFFPGLSGRALDLGARLKYCPTFPERSGSVEDARAFCQPFFD